MKIGHLEHLNKVHQNAVQNVPCIHNKPGIPNSGIIVRVTWHLHTYMTSLASISMYQK